MDFAVHLVNMRRRRRFTVGTSPVPPDPGDPYMVEDLSDFYLTEGASAYTTEDGLSIYLTEPGMYPNPLPYVTEGGEVYFTD